MKQPFKTIFIFLLISSFSFGQIGEYNYKRTLKGISQQWHKIVVPNELFEKTSQELSDLRIYGITESNDTIEAPYLLQLTTGKSFHKQIGFKTINTSHNDKGYYITFEIPSKQPINEIKLDFAQNNFDWRISLEGSNDENEWFTILEDYRIMSIKNELTEFKFTKLVFPNSKYAFFRLRINSEEYPQLTTASISQHEFTQGQYRSYPIKSFNTKENKKSKQTEIDIQLQLPVSVDHIKIDVSDTLDYYRPITIKYLADSVKTEKGWKYNYRKLTSGTLNSLEKNMFNFNGTTIQKLQILIDNYDNQPLSINTVEVKGYIHELYARFNNKQASYYLVYGNKRAKAPNYDITRFSENVPEVLTSLDLGDEIIIEKERAPNTAPLFKNKAWLWTIMAVIILLLGWFSLKMIRKT